MPFTLTPIEIDVELELRERRPGLADSEAIALLNSEFRFALNGLHFLALSAGDPEIIVESRTVTLQGTTRYGLTFDFVPRHASATDDGLAALVLSEFQRAVNASYFLRITGDDPRITVISPAVSNGNVLLRQAA